MRILFGIYLFTSIALFGHGQNQTNYTSQGRFELSKGRYVSAIELFNKAIQLSKFNSEAFFLRGIAKYELEDFIGAEKDFGIAIDLNPKHQEAFLYRGVCRSQQHRYGQAFDDYNESIRLNEDDWRIYSNRALASLLLDRYVDAISDCNKIIELKKASSHTYLLRGEAKAGLEMYNVAIEDFERAMKLDSMAMRPVLHRGIARGKLSEFDSAISDFEEALKLDSSNLLPVFHRGTVYSEMGKSEIAVQDFNSVLEQYPNNAVVLFNRALTYSGMSRSDDALLDYDRVVQLNPKNILGYFNRGILHHNQGALSNALADYNSAIELFPEFLDAHENRVRILQQLGRKKEYEAALVELQRIKRAIAISDKDAKTEQLVKLMKATELKGEFESIPQEVGKVQHRKVEVQLLPFYQLSAFPESDPDIAVYDGFSRPNYFETGVFALVENGSSTRTEIELKLELSKMQARTPDELIRNAVLLAMLNDYAGARKILEPELQPERVELMRHLANGMLNQMELWTIQSEFSELVGQLEVIDTAHQQKTQALMVAAEMNYRKVLEMDPEMSFAHFNLGHLLASAERYEEAETQFGLAASSSGNFIEANYNRGLIRLLLGKLSKGCEDLSLAGELGLTDSYNVIKRYCE